MYGSELEDDEDEIEEELQAREAANPSHRDSQTTIVGSAQKEGDEGGDLLGKEVNDASASKTPQQTSSKITEEASNASEGKPTESHNDSQHTTAESTQTAGDEGGDLLPKAAYDASTANKSSK